MRACRKQAVKMVWFFLFFCIIGGGALEAKKRPSKQPSIVKSSIVMCAETGEVYHQSNADVVTHPASLAKMMTLYLTFKALRDEQFTLNQKLRVSKYASKQQPSKLGLKPGTTLTVRQAILALVTKSANDAAVVLGEALGKGSEAQFAQLMTQQAQRLGMTKTVFKNASGLPNKQQVTTARDMALLSLALYRDFPKHFAFFKEQTFVYKGQVHKNHNHLLGRVKGVDGIKTGFINASGFNLAASVKRDNHRIIAVVMGGESIKARDKKMTNLLETTYTQIKKEPTLRMKMRYASIGELIHNIGPSDAHAASLEGRSPYSHASYHSLDDLLHMIESSQSKKR